ncbi:MAG: N-6 DNA methylase [Nanoarchaeota archaeon]|nr:N-6 DNA methylase [Nanoarchaeota archaeon]
MTKLTNSLESSTRKTIDGWLKELGWNINENDGNCNVFTERAKTKEQNLKFRGKKPDFILYKSGTDDPIAVIEAKQKGQSIDKALNQAKQFYAIPLGVHLIFATDGTFVKSLDLRSGKYLSVDNTPLNELISEERLLRFIQEGHNISEVTEEVKYTREELIKIFKWANELLRKEGIQKGIDRFTAFSNLLFIKIISEIEDDREKRGLKRQLKKSLCWDSFRNMEAEEMLNYINNTVLRNGLAKEYNHSDDIFQEKLKIENPKTVKEIVKKLSELTLLNTESEIKGDAFEYFLKSLGGSNDLGEYFTPRHIVRIMVDLVNPKYGNVVFDPFCGTGGFLIESFRHIKRGIEEDNKTLMDNLKKNSIFGVELTDTYKIAKMNMIITGDGHNNIIKDDTAKNEYWEKFIGKEDGQDKINLIDSLKKKGFDIILSNIPYSLPTEYGKLYPIPSNQGDSVFLQHLILNLRKGGKCGVIVPEGLLFKEFHKPTREYLLKECNLEAVISLPSGVFLPYANVKTDILIFKKGIPTKNVWFYNIENDGFELTNIRKRIKGENDLDYLRVIWESKPDDKKRLSKSFFVNIEEIEKNNFNLTFSKYRKFEYKISDQGTSDELIDEVLELESKIQQNIKLLRGFLNDNKRL